MFPVFRGCSIFAVFPRSPLIFFFDPVLRWVLNMAINKIAQRLVDLNEIQWGIFIIDHFWQYDKKDQ